MDLYLKKSVCNLSSEISITGSKSETNRLLLLQALFPNLKLENTSNSDDSTFMISALSCNQDLIDIHHAGTAMRFLTAYFATCENKTIILTGSTRMKERPIKILVDALKQLGASIEYIENEGFPPIKIFGKKITQNKVSLNANVSSQYISALLLTAPKLVNGIELTLEGQVTSIPYIKMTLSLLNQMGIETTFIGNKIKVFTKPEIENKIITVESDWSSASYFYSIVALSKIGTKIKLTSYHQNSLQGDSILTSIYQQFGVETIFDNNQIILKKNKNHTCNLVNIDLNNSPDIAQTIAVTCFGLQIECNLTGLHTLKIKETDRLEALRIELIKLGATLEVTDSSLTLKKSEKINSNITISTYQDHRMAMAFAPLALITPLYIENPEVVSKSFPTFWDVLKTVGIYS